MQIQKWIRENLPDTTHYYGVWHVAKGMLILIERKKESKKERKKERVKEINKERWI